MALKTIIKSFKFLACVAPVVTCIGIASVLPKPNGCVGVPTKM